MVELEINQSINQMMEKEKKKIEGKRKRNKKKQIGVEQFEKYK